MGHRIRGEQKLVIDVKFDLGAVEELHAKAGGLRVQKTSKVERAGEFLPGFPAL
jgi:hypothetical protein